MEKYIVATIKSWNIENFGVLKESHPDCEFKLINEKKDLSLSFLEAYKPKYIFFPHWSWIIPEDIYNNYNCIVFHSTDLPFGRGGSPLQNLIVRGIYDTKISAIKVCSGIDTGPVYFKESIDISEGSADEILRSISDIVFNKMIPRFLEADLVPVEQSGEAVSFKRRKPEQSKIPNGLSQRQIYDYIRMLDGEGYPAAFSKYDNGKVFYSNAKFEGDVVTAKAQFVEEAEDKF